MSSDNLQTWDAPENTRRVLDEWVEGLAQVLESMTDQKPEIHWHAVRGSAAELGLSQEPGTPTGNLWWEQTFRIDDDLPIWVAAPCSTWEHAGAATLKAAGLKTVELEEARNTWFEILGQSWDAMERSIGGALGCEIDSHGGNERAPDVELQDWVSVQITFGETVLAPLFVGLSPKLMTLLASPAQNLERGRREPVTQLASLESDPQQASRTLDLLLDIDLPVSISFGKARLPLKDVYKLTTGSIVELNRSVNEPVEVLVNQHLVARGEVVVVEGNYGVRILEIASRQDRLRSVQ